MRTARFASAASALVLTSVLALLGFAGTAHSAGPHYVALGDSYASGVGSGSYDSAGGSCKRSTGAYPALWSAAHAPSSFAFTACSDATTGDVVNNQLDRIGSATGLISVTIGGNDAAADDLDGVIAKRAVDHGFTFADVRDTFVGHELCSGSPWLRSLTVPVDESYHPTAAGRSGGCLPPFSAVA